MSKTCQDLVHYMNILYHEQYLDVATYNAINVVQCRTIVEKEPHFLGVRESREQHMLIRQRYQGVNHQVLHRKVVGD